MAKEKPLSFLCSLTHIHYTIYYYYFFISPSSDTPRPSLSLSHTHTHTYTHLDGALTLPLFPFSFSRTLFLTIFCLSLQKDTNLNPYQSHHCKAQTSSLSFSALRKLYRKNFIIFYGSGDHWGVQYSFLQVVVLGEWGPQTSFGCGCFF